MKLESFLSSDFKPRLLLTVDKSISLRSLNRFFLLMSNMSFSFVLKSKILSTDFLLNLLLKSIRKPSEPSFANLICSVFCEVVAYAQSELFVGVVVGTFG